MWFKSEHRGFIISVIGFAAQNNSSSMYEHGYKLWITARIHESIPEKTRLCR